LSSPFISERICLRSSLSLSPVGAQGSFLLVLLVVLEMEEASSSSAFLSCIGFTERAEEFVAVDAFVSFVLTLESESLSEGQVAAEVAPAKIALTPNQDNIHSNRVK